MLPRQAWVGVVALQTLLSAPASVRCRAASSIVERVRAVVDEKLIDEHEEAGHWFLAGAALTLGVAITALALKDSPAARRTAVATIALLLLQLSMAWRTGHLGGRLVYRHGAARAFVPEDGGDARGKDGVPK